MRKQNAILGQAEQATDDDCQVLDTILGLEVSFMPAAVHPPSLALQAPWQLPATLQQAPAWAWKEVLCCLQPLGNPGLAPSLDLVLPRAQTCLSPTSSCQQWGQDYMQALLATDTT